MAAITRVYQKMACEFVQFVVFIHVIESFAHSQPTVETSGQGIIAFLIE